MGFWHGFIIGAFGGAFLGIIVACILASGKIANIIAERDNPKNFKPRCFIK